MIRRFLALLVLLTVLPSLLTAAGQFPFSFWKTGTTFNPLAQPSIKAWWDASQLAYSNGQAVDASHHFTDLTFQGNDLIANTGTVTFQTNQQNGLPAMSFNGSSALIGSTFNDNIMGVAPRTFACVVAVTSYPAYREILGDVGGGTCMHLYVKTGGYITVSDNVTAEVVGNVVVPTVTYHSIITVMTASTYAFYLDGVDAGHGSTAIVFGGDSWVMMGANFAGAYFNFFLGYIGEASIYATAFDATTVASCASYLRNKWGTP